MKERRSARRVPAQTLVSYSVTEDGQSVSNEAMAKSLDLSSNGVHLALTQELSTGDRLHLTMGHGENMIELEGQAMWARGDDALFEVGLQVENPPQAYTQFIETLPES